MTDWATNARWILALQCKFKKRYESRDTLSVHVIHLRCSKFWKCSKKTNKLWHSPTLGGIGQCVLSDFKSYSEWLVLDMGHSNSHCENLLLNFRQSLVSRSSNCPLMEVSHSVIEDCFNLMTRFHYVFLASDSPKCAYCKGAFRPCCMANNNLKQGSWKVTESKHWSIKYILLLLSSSLRKWNCIHNSCVWKN